jgi:hypothetical protein
VTAISEAEAATNSSPSSSGCGREHELEGVVAKRRTGRYVPGERGWVKTKNRDYWRYEMEREGAFKARRERQFV